MRYALVLLFPAIAWAQVPGEKPAPDAKKDAVEKPTVEMLSEEKSAEQKPAEDQPFAFGGADLFIGRTMKQPMSDKVFTVGIDVGVAPVDVGLSALRDVLVAQAVNKLCGDNQACQAETKEVANTAISTIASLSDAQVTELKASMSDPNKVESLLVGYGVSPSDAQAAANYVAKANTTSDPEALVNLARKTAAGANVLFDPFIDVNLKWVALKASVPFTLSYLDGSLKANMANIGLDAKSGYAWEFGLIAFGITGGLSMYFPSGTEGASAAAMADLFSAPKYSFGYLTLSPYLVVGVDFTWLTWQAHVELDSMVRVRDVRAPDSVNFLRFGTGLVILPRLHPKWTLSIIGEINGLSPIANADPYNALFASAGLQLRLYLLKLAVAAQLPIYKGTQDYAKIPGVDIGRLSDVYVLVRLAFVF